MAFDTYEALRSTPIDRILLAASVLVGLSLVFARAAGRLGVPALALFLVVGMLAGSDGPGGIYFDDPWLAQFLGVSALTVILFAGGLDTDWHQVRPVLWPAVALSTAGVALTAALVGLFAAGALGFGLREGLLMGAVISSTDTAAVFMVLRSKKVALRGRLAPLLELESGSNDPMAVFLTTALVQVIMAPGTSPVRLAASFVVQMALGGALGYGLGRAGLLLLHRMRFEQEALYPLLAVTLAVFVYALVAIVGGSGFLAVYVAGLVIGNSGLPYRRFLMRFSDSLAWLGQIVMFLTLGLLVFPREVANVIGPGLALATFLMFVARPVAVLGIVPLFGMRWREALLAAWVGLRGAVPIILATVPTLAGVAGARTIFNVVFFVVLTSALVQGTSVPYVARWLGVAATERVPRRSPLELVPNEAMDSELLELAVPLESPLAGKPVAQLGLPKETLIVMLSRNGQYRVPTGSTRVEAGDMLFILGPRAVLDEVRSRFTVASEPERQGH
ncbi:potassium/proton antiporter [Carboxydochorda subterranea]|uniref:Potassium/proton antiporter n=1 Tax=Carboxydichorda subterranea TaxID=3109565 RepID=A0ABZ1BVQ0_9FIRM|nr:potassium/proton antiporter [Limnochorda sp. L945t]WRP16695.1 potassium/proton antiporter [Limnochorda sp. L945t]